MPWPTNSDLIRKFGPPAVALAFAATWMLVINGPSWGLSKLSTANTPLIAACTPVAGVALFGLGSVFYWLYRAVLYLRLMALHDALVKNTARRDIIQRYAYANKHPSELKSADAEALFRDVMSDVPHHPRRLEMSDRVHFAYQSALISLFFLAASIFFQKLVLAEIYFAGLVTFAVLGWVSNNDVEAEERSLLKTKFKQLDKAADRRGFVRN